MYICTNPAVLATQKNIYDSCNPKKGWGLVWQGVTDPAPLQRYPGGISCVALLVLYAYSNYTLKTRKTLLKNGKLAKILIDKKLKR